MLIKGYSYWTTWNIDNMVNYLVHVGHAHSIEMVSYLERNIPQGLSWL